MIRLLSIDPTVLGNLTPVEAVQTFRLLLCGEADRLGIPSSAVNVPAAVTVADGGIDASINANITLPVDGLICSPMSRFQIKTGDSFKPWQDAAIKKELFGDHPAGDKENLGPAVWHCMDNGGRYVVVCFGMDVVEQNLIDARKHLTDHFKACGYANPNIDVIGQSGLISACEQFGGLVRRLGPPAADGVRDHRSWSLDLEMARPFTPNQPQDSFIDQIRAALRDPDAKHVRVCGEAGIGKSRLVLEATRVDDFQPRVLYCHAADLTGRGLLPFLVDDERRHAILIVDECDPEARANLVDRLGAHFPRIRVISIYQEFDRSSGVRLLTPPSLEDDAVVAIIASHGTPRDIAQRWARLCSGSPRVAHVIGENLRTNPEDVLKPPSSNNIWDRYIQGGRSADDDRARQIRTVLRYLALFERFGFEEPVSDEAKAIASMIEQADRDITWNRFRELIAELRERRILQGERTLYITPQALHIWLWVEWWDVYGGQGFELDPFVSQLKGKLLKWFTAMFKYAHESEAAARTVTRLLGPNGPFADGELLRTEIGSDFFLALTDANPEAAVACLERTVGAWTRDQLSEFKTGRNGVRFALERIVVWRQLFVRGAHLLSSLAAAENERWSNNSTGVFAALFSPGYGAVAPTEASPEERFPVLVETIESSDPIRRAIGLKAADKALETGHFWRMSGAEFQGLKQPPKLWRPKVWAELVDAYRRVWNLLVAQAIAREGDERDQIVNVMLRRAHGLIQMPHVALEVIGSLRDLLARGVISPKALTKMLEDLLQRNPESPKGEIRTAAIALRDSLVGTDLSSRLRRYIGITRLDDVYEDGKQTDRWEKIADELADEAMRQPDLLRAAIPWLVTRDAENAGAFGVRIALRDSGRIWMQDVVEGTRTVGESDRSLGFASGYMRALFQKETEVWEAELDRWSNDADLAPFVVEVTWRSGMTDRALRRMIALLKAGVVRVEELGVLRFGRPIAELNEAPVIELISALLASTDAAGVGLSVELLHGYYERTEADRELPIALVERALTDERLFARTDSFNRSMTGYIWIKLATSLIGADSSAGPRLLALLIKHADDSSGFLDRYDNDLTQLTDRILRESPEEAWNVIVARLNTDDRHDRYTVLHWLSGGSMVDDSPGYWAAVPLDQFWKWVDEDVDERAWLVASLAPRTLDANDVGIVTRQLLTRYGDREDVRRNLTAHFSSGSWWGEASDHFRKLKQIAEGWLAVEKDTRIRQWLEQYVQALALDIEHSLVREERGRF